ncbi:MAG: UDP-N-acetylmuramate--L-alanine ligase [Bacteroidales bacterium]|nr:UDP-N-acetylmuramate--L-alanine ligase [Bacteroidales bacterium]
MSNKTIYFLGIGGIGMSALAQYYLHEGAIVHGYDLTPSPITERLSQMGAVIHYEEDCSKIPAQVDMVVVTPAIPKEHAEYQYFLKSGVKMHKRSEVLGHIADALPTIAVAGTHGKTTTTSLVAHLLSPQVPIAGFIGGVAKNFDNNFVYNDPPQYAVVEADEYDRSFLTLHPAAAIITSMDADHLDIYGTRENLIAAFGQFAQQSRYLIAEQRIAPLLTHPDMVTYGFQPEADFYAYNVDVKPNALTFDLRMPDGEWKALRLRANGLYNVLNATAAIAAVRHSTNISEDIIREKLASFLGVKRRFEYVVERPDFIYIDDYAHHPQEIQSVLTAVRELYPDRKLTCIFQPHLYSRTRDLADGFATVLSMADKVILLPIYPARELPIEGITSEWLLGKVTQPDKLLLQKSELIPYLQQHPQELLLTVGAGDIDRLVPQIGEL